MVLGLVVAGWVKGEVSEEFAGLGCDDSDVEVGDQQGYGGVFVSSADADVVGYHTETASPIAPSRAPVAIQATPVPRWLSRATLELTPVDTFSA